MYGAPPPAPAVDDDRAGPDGAPTETGGAEGEDGAGNGSAEDETRIKREPRDPEGEAGAGGHSGSAGLDDGKRDDPPRARPMYGAPPPPPKDR